MRQTWCKLTGLWTEQPVGEQQLRKMSSASSVLEKLELEGKISQLEAILVTKPF